VGLEVMFHLLGDIPEHPVESRDAFLDFRGLGAKGWGFLVVVEDGLGVGLGGHGESGCWSGLINLKCLDVDKARAFWRYWYTNYLSGVGEWMTLLASVKMELSHVLQITSDLDCSDHVAHKIKFVGSPSLRLPKFFNKLEFDKGNISSLVCQTKSQDIKQEMWHYDNNEGMWENEQTARSYDPSVADQFFHNGQNVEIEDVPMLIRQELEDTARDEIIQIVGDDQVAWGEPVDFTNEFQQGDDVMTIQMEENTVFGSGGATPCLIIFLVGRLPHNYTWWAKGAHRDNVFNLGDDFLEQMMQSPDEQYEWENLRLYIIGGETGSHTGVDESTMDYSRYYPFFDSCDEFGIEFGGVTFPSNPTPANTSSAVLRLIDGNIQAHYWNNAL